MNLRVRRLVPFLFLVISMQIACVLFYELLRSNNHEISQAQRTLVEWKATLTNKHARKLKRRKKRDDIINGLQKQITSLLDQLDRLNRSCHEPVKSASAATRKESHQKSKYKGSPKDSSENNRKLEDKKGDSNAKLVAKNSKKYNASGWITDKGIFDVFTRTTIFSVKSLDSPQDYLTYKTLARNGKHGHLNHAMEDTFSILKDYLNLDSSINLTLQTGLYRDDVNFGTEYDIRVSCRGDTYNVRLIRPLSPLILVNPPVKLNPEKLINIIVPLQGRLERFQEFLNNFKQVCISRKENVFLTVVYSSKQGVGIVKHMLNTLAKDHGFTNFELVKRKQNFHRGHALHDGVRHWKGEKDVLLFFCDVDVVFDSGFIDRCRTFTEPGRTVYYPIVFSLYNPKYVRQTTTHLRAISKETGYWRYYGYGMTCQHRQDYFKVGGFDLNIKGWGTEDVQLHHRYITHPNLRIIRAPDTGLFHLYHNKDCDSTLPWKQYRNCMGTKLNTEASKRQYGRRVVELEKKLGPVLPNNTGLVLPNNTGPVLPNN